MEAVIDPEFKAKLEQYEKEINELTNSNEEKEKELVVLKYALKSLLSEVHQLQKDNKIIPKQKK